MSVSAIGRLGRAVVFHVASKDLLSEKLISACLVLSVVAVLTPILLLASVKVGFIDRLKQDFIQDPTFREIKPAQADLRRPDLFEEMRGWPNVRYVMPSVMLVPREVDYIVQTASTPHRAQATLVPSDAADPVHEKLIAGAPPSGDGVVVTQDVAQAAGLEVGSSFELSASRIENDRRRRVGIPVTVTGILAPEALSLPSILAVSDIDRQIEAYRAGVSVPERGWEGVHGAPKQSFQNIVVAASGPLGESIVSSLAIRIGATSVEELEPEAFLASGGADKTSGTAAAQKYIVLGKGARDYTSRDVEEANEVLRNAQAEAFGLNPPPTAQVLGTEVEVAGYEPGLATLPDLADVEKVRSLGAAYVLNDRILLPRSLEAAWDAAGRPVEIDLGFAFDGDWATRRLDLKVRVMGVADIEPLLASGSLVAMVRRARHVPVAFDPANTNIVEQTAGYRGFRAIAEDIDTLPTLVERFRDAGIEVRARSDEILKLQRLDRSLNILVWVVAAVGLLGGYAILTSSFFANVQRKQVDYATLRLLGMPKRKIFRIPTAQAVIIAVLGFAISVLCYFMVAGLLNGFIARELNFDGQLSKLYPWHFVSVGVFVLIGSCLASVAASREATSIDPAQALRGG